MRDRLLLDLDAHLDDPARTARTAAPRKVLEPTELLAQLQRSGRPLRESLDALAETDRASYQAALSAIHTLRGNAAATRLHGEIMARIGARRTASEPIPYTALSLVENSARGVLARAGRDGTHEMPHRQVLEDALGTSFTDVQATSGPETRRILDGIGADAAVLGPQHMLLRERTPSRVLVAEEATHIEQMRASVGPRLDRRILDAPVATSQPGDAAEREADQVRAAYAEARRLPVIGERVPTSDALPIMRSTGGPRAELGKIELHLGNARFTVDPRTHVDGELDLNLEPVPGVVLKRAELLVGPDGVSGGTVTGTLDLGNGRITADLELGLTRDGGDWTLTQTCSGTIDLPGLLREAIPIGLEFVEGGVKTREGAPATAAFDKVSLPHADLAAVSGSLSFALDPKAGLVVGGTLGLALAPFTRLELHASLTLGDDATYGASEETALAGVIVGQLGDAHTVCPGVTITAPTLTASYNGKTGFVAVGAAGVELGGWASASPGAKQVESTEPMATAAANLTYHYPANTFDIVGTLQQSAPVRFDEVGLSGARVALVVVGGQVVSVTGAANFTFGDSLVGSLETLVLDPKDLGRIASAKGAVAVVNEIEVGDDLVITDFSTAGTGKAGEESAPASETASGATITITDNAVTEVTGQMRALWHPFGAEQGFELSGTDVTWRKADDDLSGTVEIRALGDFVLGDPEAWHVTLSAAEAEAVATVEFDESTVKEATLDLNVALANGGEKLGTGTFGIGWDRESGLCGNASITLSAALFVELVELAQGLQLGVDVDRDGPRRVAVEEPGEGVLHRIASWLRDLVGSSEQTKDGGDPAPSGGPWLEGLLQGGIELAREAFDFDLRGQKLGFVDDGPSGGFALPWPGLPVQIQASVAKPVVHVDGSLAGGLKSLGGFLPFEASLAIGDRSIAVEGEAVGVVAGSGATGGVSARLQENPTFALPGGHQIRVVGGQTTLSGGFSSARGPERLRFETLAEWVGPDGATIANAKIANASLGLQQDTPTLDADVLFWPGQDAYTWPVGEFAGESVALELHEGGITVPVRANVPQPAKIAAKLDLLRGGDRVVKGAVRGSVCFADDGTPLVDGTFTGTAVESLSFPAAAGAAGGHDGFSVELSAATISVGIARNRPGAVSLSSAAVVFDGADAFAVGTVAGSLDLTTLEVTATATALTVKEVDLGERFGVETGAWDAILMPASTATIACRGTALEAIDLAATVRIDHDGTQAGVGTAHGTWRLPPVGEAAAAAAAGRASHSDAADPPTGLALDVGITTSRDIELGGQGDWTARALAGTSATLTVVNGVAGRLFGTLGLELARGEVPTVRGEIGLDLDLGMGDGKAAGGETANDDAVDTPVIATAKLIAPLEVALATGETLRVEEGASGTFGLDGLGLRTVQNLGASALVLDDARQPKLRLGLSGVSVDLADPSRASGHGGATVLQPIRAWDAGGTTLDITSGSAEVTLAKGKVTKLAAGLGYAVADTSGAELSGKLHAAAERKPDGTGRWAIDGEATFALDHAVTLAASDGAYTAEVQRATGTVTLADGKLGDLEGSIGAKLSKDGEPWLRVNGDGALRAATDGRGERTYASSGKIAVQLLRELRLDPVEAGGHTWQAVLEPVGTSAFGVIEKSALKRATGAFGARIDRDGKPFATGTFLGVWDRVQGLRTTGAVELLSDLAPRTIGEWTGTVRKGSGVVVKTAGTAVTHVGGSLQIDLADASGPLLSGSVTTAPMPLASPAITGSAALKLLRDESLAVGPWSVELGAGSKLEVGLQRNRPHRVSGSSDLTLKRAGAAIGTLQIDDFLWTRAKAPEAKEHAAAKHGVSGRFTVKLDAPQALWPTARFGGEPLGEAVATSAHGAVLVDVAAGSSFSVTLAQGALTGLDAQGVELDIAVQGVDQAARLSATPSGGWSKTEGFGATELAASITAGELEIGIPDLGLVEGPLKMVLGSGFAIGIGFDGESVSGLWPSGSVSVERGTAGEIFSAELGEETEVTKPEGDGGGEPWLLEKLAAAATWVGEKTVALGRWIAMKLHDGASFGVDLLQRAWTWLIDFLTFEFPAQRKTQPPAPPKQPPTAPPIGAGWWTAFVNGLRIVIDAAGGAIVQVGGFLAGLASAAADGLVGIGERIAAMGISVYGAFSAVLQSALDWLLGLWTRSPTKPKGAPDNGKLLDRLGIRLLPGATITTELDGGMPETVALSCAAAVTLDQDPVATGALTGTWNTAANTISGQISAGSSAGSSSPIVLPIGRSLSAAPNDVLLTSGWALVMPAGNLVLGIDQNVPSSASGTLTLQLWRDGAHRADVHLHAGYDWSASGGYTGSADVNLVDEWPLYGPTSPANGAKGGGDSTGPSTGASSAWAIALAAGASMGATFAEGALTHASLRTALVAQREGEDALSLAATGGYTPEAGLEGAVDFAVLPEAGVPLYDGARWQLVLEQTSIGTVELDPSGVTALSGAPILGVYDTHAPAAAQRVATISTAATLDLGTALAGTFEATLEPGYTLAEAGGFTVVTERGDARLTFGAAGVESVVGDGSVTMRAPEAPEQPLLRVDASLAWAPAAPLAVTGSASVEPEQRLPLGGAASGWTAAATDGTALAIAWSSSAGLTELSGTLDLALRAPEASTDTASVTLAGGLIDGGVDGTGTVEVLDRLDLGAAEVNGETWTLRLAPGGTRAAADVVDGALVSANGSLALVVEDALGKFAGASAGVAWTGEGATRGEPGLAITEASLAITRQKILGEIGEGDGALTVLIDENSNLQATFDGFSPDVISGEIAIAVDRPLNERLATLTLEDTRYTFGTGALVGRGTGELKQTLTVVETASETVELDAGARLDFAFSASGLERVEGSLGVTVSRKATEGVEPFLTGSLHGHWTAALGELSALGSATTLRHLELAELGGYGLWLRKGASGSATLTQAGIHSLAGGFAVSVCDAGKHPGEGPTAGAGERLRISVENAAYDPAAAQPFTGTGAARVMAAWPLVGSPEDATYLELRDNSAISATLGSDGIERAEGQLGFGARVGGHAFAGYAEGAWSPEAGASASGGVWLEEDVVLELGGGRTATVKAGSGGQGSVAASALEAVSGRCEVVFDGPEGALRGTLTAEASFERDEAGALTLRDAFGEFEQTGAVSAAGGKVRVWDLAGTVKFTDGEFEVATGDVSVSVGPAGQVHGESGVDGATLTGMHGTATVTVRRGDDDGWQVSGGGELGLVIDKGETHFEAEAKARFEADGTWTASARGNLKIHEAVEGEVEIVVDQDLAPVVRGSMAVEKELMGEHEWFAAEADIAAEFNTVIVIVPVTASIGARLGFRLATDPVVLSASLAFDGLEPLSGQGADEIDADFGLEMGVSATLGIYPYASVGLGVSGLSAGFRVKGAAEAEADATLEPTFSLHWTPEGGVETAFDLGIDVTVDATLSATLEAYAEAFGFDVSGELGTIFETDLGEIFAWSWTANPEGTAAPVPAVAAGAGAETTVDSQTETKPDMGDYAESGTKDSAGLVDTPSDGEGFGFDISSLEDIPGLDAEMKATLAALAEGGEKLGTFKDTVMDHYALDLPYPFDALSALVPPPVKLQLFVLRLGWSLMMGDVSLMDDLVNPLVDGIAAIASAPAMRKLVDQLLEKLGLLKLIAWFQAGFSKERLQGEIVPSFTRWLKGSVGEHFQAAADRAGELLDASVELLFDVIDVVVDGDLLSASTWWDLLAALQMPVPEITALLGAIGSGAIDWAGEKLDDVAEFAEDTARDAIDDIAPEMGSVVVDSLREAAAAEVWAELSDAERAEFFRNPASMAARVDAKFEEMIGR